MMYTLKKKNLYALKPLCVVPALQEQGNKVKEQVQREKHEYRKIEMNVESMMTQVQEPPSHRKC